MFFLPFGIDALVIYLVARDRDWFWIYPLLVVAGSLVGGAFTYWLGRKGGEAGLQRIVSPRRLERLQARVRAGGAFAMIIPAMLPPPFPLTPFILACGALEVSRWRFLATLGVGRLIRFGAEAVLARTYGSGIVSIFESDAFRYVMFGLAALAIAGTALSALHLWRTSHASRASA